MLNKVLKNEKNPPEKIRFVVDARQIFGTFRIGPQSSAYLPSKSGPSAKNDKNLKNQKV